MATRLILKSARYHLRGVGQNAIIPCRTGLVPDACSPHLLFPPIISDAPPSKWVMAGVQCHRKN